MNDIHSVSIEPLRDSIYVKPITMKYTQSGVEKAWDFTRIHDSVCILIYNISRKVLVFVKQFRPAVYYNSIPECERGLNIDTNRYSPSDRGFTLELCAGIVDKELSLEEIAREEVLEECGYDVPLTHFKRILSYRSGIGVSGDKQTLFYAEVNDNMKATKGGGNAEEGEMIEVVELSVADTKKYMESGDVLSPGGFLFALMWFFKNKEVV